MKKKYLSYLLIAAMGMSILAGCGDKKEEENASQSSLVNEIKEEAIEEQPEPVKEEEAVQEEEPVQEESREGMYRSELTGDWIDEALMNQRPVAVMVDNETTALPHFGVNDADIVYEMMNSTQNGRITRLMCIVKDWGNIKQLGSIRSTRPTNIPLAAEYNAVLVHDGGPFYIDTWISKDYSANFSGGFSRVNNGKAREFTEYVMSGDLDKRFSSSKYSREYNNHYSIPARENGEPGSHFDFSTSEVDLSSESGAIPCTEIKLPFSHTSSTLKYDADKKEYALYLYGNPHKDGASGEVLTFKNLLIQNVSFTQLDDHGYMIYNCIDGRGNDAYYITNGTAIPVKWVKASDTAPTVFTKADGSNVKLNIGKTYVSLVPSDTWSNVEIK